MKSSKSLKKWPALALALTSCCMLLSGCGQTASSDASFSASSGNASENTSIASASLTSDSAASALSSSASPVTYTDALGHDVTLTAPTSVVSAYGSYAEAWSLAGGSLIGITQDTLDEGREITASDPAIIGTVKEPSLEKILALSPDLVLLSADIDGQVALDSSLTEAGITHIYLKEDTCDDYLALMQLFCSLTGRQDLYEQNASAVSDKVQEVISSVPAEEEHPTFLLIRAFSSGAKAQDSDSIAGVVLTDLGGVNIAESDDSLLEDLSAEVILKEDPDYIFVVTMGDEDEAWSYLEDGLFQNPLWSSLSAVSQDHVILLPKDLFHYKPNARWGESYEYLANILYTTK